MKVYTSYFAKHRTKRLDDVAYISISVGNPKYPVPYEIKDACSLKPFGVFGKYEGDDYEREYRRKLERTGTAKIREEVIRLSEGHETVLLMCHEKDPNECHRKIFAQWWQEKTGQEIPEYGFEETKAEENQIDLFDRL